MKCPKCQYFSFDSGARCRNCGYDFSLALDLPPADLPIQDGTEPFGPLSDFSLNDIPNLPLFTSGNNGGHLGQIIFIYQLFFSGYQIIFRHNQNNFIDNFCLLKYFEGADQHWDTIQ